MEPEVLTVYQSQHEKIRLGKDYDGGYIICNIPNIKYDCLLAGGIENDLSFEEDFVKMYEIKCYAYDGTINEINTTEKNIEFIKKNINNNNNNNETNLHDIIDSYENIMVKMDIEGGEIPWINSLNENQMNKFVQIVMEFHNPFSENELAVFKKINKTHLLVHFHANNCCGVRNIKGTYIPNIFECTYINKKYLNLPYELNKNIIPSDIDMKNVLSNDEIIINYKPFVN
jgi:hypothetical protein